MDTKSWSNILEIKVNHMLFKLVSGMRVNFYKILLVDVNINDLLLEEASTLLCYKWGKMSFK